MDMLAFIISLYLSLATSTPANQPAQVIFTRPARIMVTKMINGQRVTIAKIAPANRRTLVVETKPKVTAPTKPVTGINGTGIFTYTNEARITEGLARLTRNATLDKIALERAREMLAEQYFSHESPSGSTFDVLARQYNYMYRMIGENIAMGTFKTSEAIVTGWMNSPGHRANILKTDYTEIGVAAVEGIYAGRRQWMAVQIFGNSR